MIEDKVRSIIGELELLNPGFKGYYFDRTKEEYRGLEDNLGNQFYIEIRRNEDGNNISFQSAEYLGCGSYDVTAPIDLVFFMDCKYVGEKALKILVDQLSTFEEIRITEGSWDAENIYRNIFNSELGQKVTIIRVRGNLVTPYLSGKCLELCRENCC